MWAAGYGQADAVRVLVDAGADVTLEDDRGMTALTLAEQGGHDAVAQVLRSAR